MGWSHPYISMEDLLDSIKVFVDILVLAAGYQSSGLPAIWDADNIKKAVRWGLFFENVLGSLRINGSYEESAKELDEALLNLKSDPVFPMGLAHMSSMTLSNARRFVLEHLLHTHIARDEHFTSFLRAVVEMDIDGLSESHTDCINAFIKRLTLQMESLDFATAGRGLAHEIFPENCPNASKSFEKADQNILSHPNVGTKVCIGVDTSLFVAQEIFKRQAIISCLSSIEKGLDVFSEYITENKMGSESPMFKWNSSECALSDEDQILMELQQFNLWRSKCLLYLLDKRTIKLLSGLGFIFQAPKEQWIQIFEGLKASADSCSDNLLEILEILLLGLTSSKWNYVIQQILTISCDFLSISKKLLDLNESLQRNISVLHSNKGNDILEYLTSLLRSCSHKLWKLPSILVAAAIPTWSVIFRTHLNDVERHYNEHYSATSQHGSKHQDSEVTERIQSLYLFHIRCSSGRL